MFLTNYGGSESGLSPLFCLQVFHFAQICFIIDEMMGKCVHCCKGVGRDLTTRQKEKKISMALRRIICIEDELLRKKSRPVDKFDEKLHKLLDDMAETMYNANGVGLAAPQVAVLRRVVVMDCGDGLIEMVNPEIIETEGEQDGPEGCLSAPGRGGMVKRPMKVRARFQDRNGEWYEIEAEELLARCIMHETDHLDGQLYVDIMSRELFDEDDPQDEETEDSKA